VFGENKEKVKIAFTLLLNLLPLHNFEGGRGVITKFNDLTGCISEFNPTRAYLLKFLSGEEMYPVNTIKTVSVS